MPLSSSSRIQVATKHRKDEIFSAVFKDLGWSCEGVEVDTDTLGTFSGEVERQGSVRETLRKKINLAMAKKPTEQFFLASEGSYLPHPLFGFVSVGIESLLFFDRTENTEIYCEYIDEKPVHDERVFKQLSDAEAFIKSLGFPQQAVIVHPRHKFNPIFKGVQSEDEFLRAFLASQKESPEVLVSTDLRAMHSPRRRWALEQAARKLAEVLQCDCPKCGAYGFGFVRGVEGLPCEDCGEPTRWVAQVIHQCPRCGFEKSFARPDGLTLASADRCDFCNP